MEKDTGQFMKYYQQFDIMVFANGKLLSAIFHARAKGKDEIVKNYELEGLIKAFEIVPAKSNCATTVWISIVMDLMEPTYYIWNYEMTTSNNELKEISKIELGHEEVSILCCPPAIQTYTSSEYDTNNPTPQMSTAPSMESTSLSLKMYLVSPRSLMELTLPETGSRKYTLREISKNDNPYCVFDAIGSKVVVATEKGFDLLDTDTQTSKKIWDKDISIVKLTKDAKKAAIGLLKVRLVEPRV